jgi:hypothetical protein
MNNILNVPSSIERIGAEVNFHGDKINKEIFTMHQIIDQQGKGIQDNIFEQGTSLVNSVDSNGYQLCTQVDLLKHVIDTNGKNMQIEMRDMRKSFEKEMSDLKKTTKVVCVGMLCANIISRIILK